MLCPKSIIIKELLSVWTARRARTALTIIGETLPCFELARYQFYGQMHTDATQRRQISRDNILISPRDDDGKLLCPKLLSTTILSENGKAETVCNSIVATFEAKAHLLTDWKEIHERMFPGDEHNIPNARDISITKLHNGGVVTTDTCNSARSLATKLVRTIIEKEV